MADSKGKKIGFFARLFGKSKSERDDEKVVLDSPCACCSGCSDSQVKVQKVSKKVSKKTSTKKPVVKKKKLTKKNTKKR